MIDRRTFLLAPAALAFAQPLRPRVAIVWITGKTIPADFADQSVVFPRAYAASPKSRRAVETGKFPHAIHPGDPEWGDLFPPGSPDDASTITVMTGESGDGDDSPSERSIHVPLAIRWPGKLEPRVASDILVSHIDLLPTILTLSGGAPAGTVQGRDLSHLIQTSQGEPPDSIYAEGQRGASTEWRVVIRGFDKLILNLEDQPTALYNLADDPSEEMNLLPFREHLLTRDGLLALARQWRQRVGDRQDPSGLKTRP